jgi:protein-arginine deiminase
VDLLESQQIQKPIHLNTGWLAVGHVDEIVSFVPDPKCRLGFSVLIACPRKFYELIGDMDPETIIFDNVDNYYIFNNSSREVKDRFTQKYKCIYNSKMKVKDILNWSEMIKDNHEYQAIMDDNRTILMNTLHLQKGDFYEVPVFYWPKSLAPRAKSILPNMINNLYTDNFMIVPKPFGPTIGNNDIFEQYFASLIPKSVRVYFVSNWDSYFLLEGDIHCGTNVKRQRFRENWWGHMPENSYTLY